MAGDVLLADGSSFLLQTDGVSKVLLANVATRTTAPVTVYPGANLEIINAGQPVVAIFGGAVGGLITNPGNSTDQGIGTVEELYYSLVGDAADVENANTFALQPGATLFLPAGITSDISVNAKTARHRFSAVMWQPKQQPIPTPVPSDFPPAGPTTITKVIPSYLYEQYQDDDDLQAWVRAYNASQQAYVDWFNQTPLSIYTNPLIGGSLLDWVAQGLYGMIRPTLTVGTAHIIGPYNTSLFNQLGFNSIRRINPTGANVATDDIFKRIMTWRLYRGDGKTFNMNWLKRRCIRFLGGVDGTDVVIDNTYAVSANYSSRFNVDLVLPADPNAATLKEAIDSSAVELPFQLSFNVTIAS